MLIKVGQTRVFRQLFVETFSLVLAVRASQATFFNLLASYVRSLDLKVLG